MRTEEATCGAADGAELTLRLFFDEEGPTGSVLVHFHGGGLIAGSVDRGAHRAFSIAAATGIPIVSVEYRLAPEHPYPTPLEDCYAALAWTHAHLGVFDASADRVIVGGESAGGNLAAAVALLARDRGHHPIAAQYLGCPMLDHRTGRVPSGPTQWLTWSAADNRTGWDAYLRGLDPDADVPGYASPAIAADLAGLPPAFIDVGGLDLFRDEDIAYAARLWQAGVPCDLHVHPGAPHGFTALAPDAPLSRRADALRDAFLMSVGGSPTRWQRKCVEEY